MIGSAGLRCPVGEVPGTGRVRNCQPACPNEPPHGCALVIGPTCLCPQGQLRNWQKNYTCVSPSDCPEKPLNCPAGEVEGSGPPRNCQTQCGGIVCPSLVSVVERNV